MLETVIAIGVLAVLLTGFIIVFTPAAEGIRKSLNVQQADRLASTVEQELVTLRDTTYKTGFEKAYDWIKTSNPTTNSSTDAVVVYQYRADISALRTTDKTPVPVSALTGQQPGKDYIVVSMCRRVSDPLFNSTSNGDITAIEGGIYLVKCTQLIFTGGQLVSGTAGTIKDPKTGTAAGSADLYPDAVIAFTAEFHILPAKSAGYFSSSAFTNKFKSVKNPVFTRNLAIRR